MIFERKTPPPQPITDPCADPRVDCVAYRAAAEAADGSGQPQRPQVSAVAAHPPLSVSKVGLNAAGALKRIARAAVTGKAVLVDGTERDRRLAICDACEFQVAGANAGMGRCSLCGCTRAKAAFATEKCPDGRW